MSTFAVLTAALALTIAMAAPAAAGRIASDTYGSPALGQADTMSMCLDGEPPLDSCVRFPQGSSESLQSITIVDEGGLPISFTVGWDYTGDGFADVSQSFCGATGSLPLSQVWGATEVIVFPHALPGVGVLSGSQGAGLCPGVATSGTVFAEFA